MYVQEFTTLKDGYRVQINMKLVEAIMQKREGTLVVTATDTFHVSQAFHEVEAAWQQAAIT